MSGKGGEKVKKVKRGEWQKNQKLNKCQKIRYGYKGNFQIFLFSYGLDYHY